jgi:hypothetical protein
MAEPNNHPGGNAAGPTVETTGVAVAIVTALCLGTAFIYDSVLYFVIDHRLVQALTLADHIATAVRVVPYILVFLLLTAGFAYWRGAHRRPPLSRRASLVICGLAAIAVAGLWRTAIVPPSLAVDLFAFTVLVVFSLSLEIALAPGRKLRTAAELGLAWVVFTIFSGIGNGLVINTGDPYLPAEHNDIVTVKERGAITGQVISIVDRGVMIKTYRPLRRVLFIPKDEVVRVDLQSPWTPPPAK